MSSSTSSSSTWLLWLLRKRWQRPEFFYFLIYSSTPKEGLKKAAPDLHMWILNSWRPHNTTVFIIIIIIIIIISFMQSIYTYISETNYVPREYSVAAILLLLFMVLIPLVSVLNQLYFYISTFRSMCTVPNMAVFWSSLTSCFPGMLLTYFLNDFEIDSRLYYYWYQLCFYIPHALYFYCKFFIF